MNNYLQLSLEANAKVNTKKDGFYNLDADKIAIEYFQQHIVKNSFIKESSLEHLNYLIKEGYIEDFYNNYSDNDIVDFCNMLDEYIIKNPKIFESYMSISKFYNDYALKTGDKKTYLELYHHRVMNLVLFLCKNMEVVEQQDLDKSNVLFQYFKLIYNGYYQPATPTFLNAGKVKSGDLVSCFLLEMEDSLNSINFNISTAMQLSKNGGGVALNLSRLRSRGEPIKGIENASKGIIPVVKILEDSFNYADQMGQRKGAGAVYLNIFHADVIDLLNTKKINADEKSRIQTLSIGLLVPSKFFQLAKDNKDMYLFKSYSLFKETGRYLDEIDFDSEYDKLIENKNIKTIKISARDLLLNIAKTQFESGYPYLIFIDNMNKTNPLKNIGKIKMSNLCTEIAQIQKGSIINDYGVKDEINYDVNCVLGSLNIERIMSDIQNFSLNVKDAFKILTLTSLSAKIKNAPTVKNANELFRSVGLGAMNLHGYFIKNNIRYESEEAKEFVNIFFMLVNYFTIQASSEIAKHNNKSFYEFEKSDYSTGEYFDKYIEDNYSIDGSINKVSNLIDTIPCFNDFNIPTVEDWLDLRENVRSNGMFNSYRLTIAPTQSISYISNSTPSIMPISNQVEVRTYSNSTTYYPAPYLTKDNALYYKNAYIIDMKKMIDLISIVQKHIDQAISTVLYVNSNTNTNELIKLFLYSHHKGLKSLYYTRNKNLTIEECLSCGV